jgi:hypothetical protein
VTVGLTPCGPAFPLPLPLREGTKGRGRARQRAKEPASPIPAAAGLLSIRSIAEDRQECAGDLCFVPATHRRLPAPTPPLYPLPQEEGNDLFRASECVLNAIGARRS